MRVWMLDPAAMTPYYDIALTAALCAERVDVQLLTSPFLYEDQIPGSEELATVFFFRQLKKWARILRARPWLRRLARLVVYPFDLWRLWRQFLAHPPDLIHVQWMWLPALDVRLLRCMRRRVPIVLTVHDPLPNDAAMSRMADMHPITAIASHIIVHAEENRQALMQNVPLPDYPVTIVPFGPLFMEQPALTKSAARQLLSLDPAAQIILFFGAIKPYKGLQDLIEAVSMLQDQLPHLYLVAAGHLVDSAELYLEAIKSHHLDEQVRLDIGYVSSELVPAYFAACDVVCLPYRQASQSAVLFTAYRFGCPVIVTDVGGLPESVEEGRNGSIVPAGDIRALAEALRELLEDPIRQKEYGARSKELAETRFSWNQAARQTRAIYEQLVNLSS